MRILNSPEAQQELASAADTILKQHRQRALDMVPEAPEALEELVSQRDRTAVVKLLFGTQVLNPKAEHEIKVNDKFADKSTEELEFFIKHGRWPELPAK